MRWFRRKKEPDGSQELISAIRKRGEAADNLIAKLDKRASDRRSEPERRHLIIQNFEPDRRISHA